MSVKESLAIAFLSFTMTMVCYHVWTWTPNAWCSPPECVWRVEENGHQYPVFYGKDRKAFHHSLEMGGVL